jgi:hypothetical protein
MLLCSLVNVMVTSFYSIPDLMDQVNLFQIHFYSNMTQN